MRHTCYAGLGRRIHVLRYNGKPACGARGRVMTVGGIAPHEVDCQKCRCTLTFQIFKNMYSLSKARKEKTMKGMLRQGTTVKVSYSRGLSQVTYEGTITGYTQDMIGTPMYLVWDGKAMTTSGNPYSEAVRTYMVEEV